MTLFLKLAFLVISCGTACWAQLNPLNDIDGDDDIYTASFTLIAGENLCTMTLSTESYDLLHVYPDVYFDIDQTSAAAYVYTLFFPRIKTEDVSVFILIKTQESDPRPTVTDISCEAVVDFITNPIAAVQSAPNALHNHVNTKLYLTDGFAVGQVVEITFPELVKNLKVGTSPEIFCLDSVPIIPLSEDVTCTKVSITNMNKGTHEIDIHFEFDGLRFQAFEIQFELVV